MTWDYALGAVGFALSFVLLGLVAAWVTHPRRRVR